MNIPEYSVLEFSNSIKRVIEDAFGYVRIKGEVTGFKEHKSGHLYFSLQENEAVISAVCFKNMANLVNFQLENGLEVVASGRVTSYSGRSNYQIIVEKLEIAGIGAIIERIEKLKQKLLKEGLFLDIHKKKLPFFPTKIAVITSKTGAVIEDIKHRINERFPTEILLFNATVQGIKTKDDVVAGIEFFNQIHDAKKPDLIIIARGGGSFEDLLPFNDEAIIRAAFASKIPIISAIGHETDTTLLDLVADLRAPTPSAAAEVATPNIKELKINLEKFRVNLQNCVESRLNNNLALLESYRNQIIHPKNIIQQNFDKINYINERLKTTMILQLQIEDKKIASLKLPKNQLFNQINFAQNSLNKMSQDLIVNFQNFIENCNQQQKSLIKILDNSSYKSILDRGFAIIRSSSNGLITKSKQAVADEKINIELQDGKFLARVVDKKAPELF